MFFLKKEGTAVITLVNKSEFKIGRNTTNDLSINNVAISRFHSKLFIIGNELFVQDNNTQNGTYIGMERIPVNRKVEVMPGDVIGIGQPANVKEFAFEIVKTSDETTFRVNESKNVVVPDSTNCKISERSHHKVVACDDVPPSHGISSWYKESKSNLTSSSAEVISVVDSDDDNNAHEIDNNLLPIHEYSMVDDVIILDSEDEDFPSPSQMNASTIADMTDYSETLCSMYGGEEEQDDELDLKFHCSEDMWFASLSSASCPVKNLIVDSLLNKNIKYETNEDPCLVGGTNDAYATDFNIEDDVGRIFNSDISDNKTINLENDLETNLFDVHNIEDTSFSHHTERLKKRLLSADENPEISRKKRTLDESSDNQFKESDLEYMFSDCHKFPDPNINSTNTVIVSECEANVFNSDKKLSETVENLEGKLRIKPGSDTSLKNIKPFKSSGRQDKAASSEKNCESSSHSSTSKREIKKRRVEKLKELAQHSSNHKKLKSTGVVRKNNDALEKPMCKITDVNRSARLADEMVNYSSTSLRRLKSISINTRSVSSEKLLDGQRHNENSTDAKKLTNSASSMIKSSKTNLKNEIARKSSTSPLLNENDGFSSEFFEKLRPADATKREIQLKSNLTKIRSVCKRHQKKSVVFKENLCNFKDFELDIMEWRTSRSTMSIYKQYENLMKDQQPEFDKAVAISCGWSVKWLEEQKKIEKPPPLYLCTEEVSCPGENQLIKQYKENLKSELYFRLWRSIYTSWNKPKQDYLPLTQSVSDYPRSNLIEIFIERVDDCRSLSLRNIQATRRINEHIQSEEMIGHIGILRLSRCLEDGALPKKTMIFAYIATIMNHKSSDGLIDQKIELRTKMRNFKVLNGNAKLQILGYIKKHLRPFKVLTMLSTSSVARMLVDPSDEEFREPLISDECVNLSNNTDTLDESQKTAVFQIICRVFNPTPPVLLVDGPPGCGKTEVLIKVLQKIFSKQVRYKFENDLKILVVTSKEYLADDLCSRLRKLHEVDNMSLMRYNCSKLNARCAEFTVDHKAESIVKSNHSSLIDFEYELREVQAKINCFKLKLGCKNSRMDDWKRRDTELKLDSLQKKYDNLVNGDSEIKSNLLLAEARNHALEDAGVIVTSIDNCYSSNFEKDFMPIWYNKGETYRFTVCIFDDANYYDDTAMLIPVKVMVPALILIGDSTMPPLYNNIRTPFSRFVEDFKKRSPNSVIELNSNYRIIPSISSCINECFSANIYLCTKISEFPILPIFVFDFNDNQHRLEYDAVKRDSQAEFLVQLTEYLMKHTKDRIALILPDESEKSRFKNKLPKTGCQSRNLIAFLGYEVLGREANIVIISLPLTPLFGEHWLYMWATRAKQTLIICGENLYNLNCKSLNRLLSWAKSKHSYERIEYSSNFAFEKLLSDKKTPDAHKVQFYGS